MSNNKNSKVFGKLCYLGFVTTFSTLSGLALSYLYTIAYAEEPGIERFVVFIAFSAMCVYTLINLVVITFSEAVNYIVDAIERKNSEEVPETT